MSWRSLLVAATLATVPLAGCTASHGPSAGPIAFETIDQGPNSGVEERRTEVVRSQQAWQALWDEHEGEGDPPGVDFDQRMVVGVFKGQSPDGCHAAEVTNITATEEDTVRVEGEWVEVTGAFCTEQITYPFHLVELDRYDGEVTFDMEETQREHEGNGSGSR